MTEKPAIPALTPVLKPYSRVGANLVQRHSILIATIVATAICLPYGFYYAIWTPWLIVPLIVPIAIMAGLTIWALPDGMAAPATSA